MKIVPLFRIHWPNWRRLFRFWVLLSGCLSWAALAAAQATSAQAVETVSLTIQLRHSDGTAVVGEAVALERAPEAEQILPNCVTDKSGTCRWQVGRGMYQLRFSRPLDEISALALAEGGLNGLGITVGDTAVTYHFTFHNDGRVYFDAAPDAAVPSPVIPAGEMLHGGIRPTAAPSPQSTEGIAITATPSGDDESVSLDDNEHQTANYSWRLFLFIGGGLIVGGGLHLSRQKQASEQTTRRLKGQTTTRPNDEEMPHA